MKKHILPILIIALLSQCKKIDSEEVVQDQIHGKYTLLYNADKDSTFAGASFYTYDNDSIKTIVMLSGNSHVAFNGNSLDTNNSFTSFLLEHFYYGQAHQGRTTSGTFLYTNNLGEEMMNQIQFSDSISYSIPNNTLHKDSGYTLVWDGSPLVDGDQLSLFITGSESFGSTGFSILNTDSVNAGSIFINQEKLSTFESGKQYYMRLKKRVSYPIQEGQGEIIGIYEASVKTITIL